MYASARAQQYAQLQQDYTDIQGLQSTRQIKTRLFLSQYAPMISAELTPAEIKTLARDTRIATIYYSPNVTLVDESNVSVPFIEADYIRDNLGYSGSGIKIGMIEGGLPNETKSYFDEDKIFYDPNATRTYTDHANTVAAILIGEPTTMGNTTYKGIVPDATLYATRCIDSEDWRIRVEWLLSQNVHVINMSTGFIDAQYYTGHERWLDHVAINHSVHFVKASGNTGRGVTSPGLAFNIITVGCIGDNNTKTNQNDDFLYDRSAYVESPNLIDGAIPTNKPDLVAPGVDIYTPAYVSDEDYSNSGTSYAAPHVTAVVAQMCQRRPALKVQQDVMKAILTAAISHSKICYTPANDDNYDKFGAGVVNADEAYYVNNNYRFTMSTFAANSADGSQKTYTFSANKDERVRVSLSWLKYVVMNHNTPHASSSPSFEASLANLDLYVYDPSGTPVASSTTAHNNTEIVDFTANKTGTYKIIVKQTEHSDRAVYFGLAWW